MLMGTSIATANITPRVVVTSDFVEISGFKERDPDVVRVVLESGRPELAVHNLLVIGAHATMGASMQLDAHIVEERFEQMTGDFDTRMQAAATTIRDATEQFLDADEGALPQVLSELKNDIAVILGNTFDEDSKSSVIAKIEGVLLATTEQLDRKVREALDPDSPDSPLARTKNDVLCAVKEQAATVLREVRDVALMVAGNTAKADLFEKTAGKGLAFEAMIEGRDCSSGGDPLRRYREGWDADRCIGNQERRSARLSLHGRHIRRRSEVCPRDKGPQPQHDKDLG